MTKERERITHVPWVSIWSVYHGLPHGQAFWDTPQKVAPAVQSNHDWNSQPPAGPFEFPWGRLCIRDCWHSGNKICDHSTKYLAEVPPGSGSWWGKFCMKLGVPDVFTQNKNDGEVFNDVYVIFWDLALQNFIADLETDFPSIWYFFDIGCHKKLGFSNVPWLGWGNVQAQKQSLHRRWSLTLGSSS